MYTSNFDIWVENEINLCKSRCHRYVDKTHILSLLFKYWAWILQVLAFFCILNYEIKKNNTISLWISGRKVYTVSISLTETNVKAAICWQGAYGALGGSAYILGTFAP